MLRVVQRITKTAELSVPGPCSSQLARPNDHEYSTWMRLFHLMLAGSRPQELAGKYNSKRNAVI